MMKKTLIRTLTIGLCLLLPVTFAAADWDLGDGHKMHWPQLPKQGGWDVEFGGGGPGFGWRLADDWQCSKTGPVDDIHFWISWMDDLVGQIDNFSIRIAADIPDPDPTDSETYSMPGETLWERDFNLADFTIRDMTDDWQGWYDPSSGSWGLDDHHRWQQINIADIQDPFIQQEGTIYWLDIYMDGLNYVGWKESGSDHFMDDAVWWDRIADGWKELRDPITNESLDLSFVITPEPATLVLLGLGGFAMIRRRKA